MPITSYRLEYDQGNGEAVGGASWQTLVGDPSPSLLLEYTVTGSGIIAGGEDYQFRVAAANALGWGAWSAVSTIAASAAPSQMSPVITQIDTGLDPLKVKISWTAPNSNSDDITSYEIEIRQKDGDFTASPSCDGSNSTIRNRGYCMVPSTELMDDPGLNLPVFDLEKGDLVAARARAINSIGSGQFSQPNSAGAIIQ
jgi:hypothetical protein